MPDNYYQAQLDHEIEIRTKERISARSVINSRAPEADRQIFLDALGLLEP